MGNLRNDKERLSAARENLNTGRSQSYEAKTRLDEAEELRQQQKDLKTQLVEGMGAVAQQLADARIGLGQLDNLFNDGAKTSKVISAKAGLAQRHYETAKTEAEHAQDKITQVDSSLAPDSLPPIQAAHATKNIASILGSNAKYAVDGFVHYREIVCSEFSGELSDMITRLEELAKSVSKLGEPEEGTRAGQIHTTHYLATGANPDNTITAFDAAIEIIDSRMGTL